MNPTPSTENPFFSGESNGHKFYAIGSTDRISRVRLFDRKQYLAALALPDLQKTVTRAIERRLRQLERSQQ